MKRHTPRPCIVAPAGHDGFLRIRSLIENLGYPPAEFCNTADPVARPQVSHGTVYVALLDGQSTQEFENCLQHLDPFPVLGLLAADVAVTDCPSLRHCSDFAIWPCSERELRIRLALLGENPESPPVGTSTESVPAEYLGLCLVGQSPPFLDVLDTIERVAPYDITVSIYGETGTGKELAARALHYLGARADGPFVPVNCGALPDSLLENELFGHERGAFTDAHGSAPGLIGQAHGGTLFLDEIEALSPKSQVAMLRFLEDGHYRPLGSKTLKSADVRIITASNVAFADLRAAGKLRDDLFFRLNVVPIAIPPLRERVEDIPTLATHFLDALKLRYDKPSSYLHDSTRRWMKEYPWPGNVRELEHGLERALLLARGDAIFAADVLGLPDPNLETDPVSGVAMESFNTAKAKVVETFEKQYLACVLSRCKGNVSHAAQFAGKERRAFGKLLKKHDVEPAHFRPA